MGHGQKNANRGAAIQRNTERVQRLAHKLGKIDGELQQKLKHLVTETQEQFEAVTEEMESIRNDLDAVVAEINQRLDLLERSIWRKFMDKAKDIVSSGDPANPTNRAVQLDIHSVRHEAHSRIKKAEKKEEQKEDGGTESRDA